MNDFEKYGFLRILEKVGVGSILGPIVVSVRQIFLNIANVLSAGSTRLQHALGDCGAASLIQGFSINFREMVQVLEMQKPPNAEGNLPLRSIGVGHACSCQ